MWEVFDYKTAKVIHTFDTEDQCIRYIKRAKDMREVLSENSTLFWDYDEVPDPTSDDYRRNP